MIRTSVSAVVCLVLYAMMMVPFTTYIKNKPFLEKLGYVPSVSVLKSVAADQKELVAAAFVLKVMMYFGGLIEKSENQFFVPPDYKSMSRLLHGAVKLDPYNMDAYYFAQSFLTWDAKQYKLANDLLDYGMTYRTWDWYLPFFAGFNSVYFLKDYVAAAKYYQRAGNLSGSDLSKLLAGRYMQESGQTVLAIGYLSAMAKGEKNQAVKKTYELRLKAFKEVRRIELARDQYMDAQGVMPTTIQQLLSAGFLTTAPTDPYGGKFYIEPDGKVATTSKFAFGVTQKDGQFMNGDTNERH